MVPCKSTAKEVSFEWSHHRILFTDSKVRTTLHVSIIDSETERVKEFNLAQGLLGILNSHFHLTSTLRHLHLPYCALEEF